MSMVPAACGARHSRQLVDVPTLAIIVVQVQIVLSKVLSTCNKLMG